jgi:hypothetical protein
MPQKIHCCNELLKIKNVISAANIKRIYFQPEMILRTILKTDNSNYKLAFKKTIYGEKTISFYGAGVTDFFSFAGNSTVRTFVRKISFDQRGSANAGKVAIGQSVGS